MCLFELCCKAASRGAQTAAVELRPTHPFRSPSGHQDPDIQRYYAWYMPYEKEESLCNSLSDVANAHQDVDADKISERRVVKIGIECWLVQPCESSEAEVVRNRRKYVAYQPNWNQTLISDSEGGASLVKIIFSSGVFLLRCQAQIHVGCILTSRLANHSTRHKSASGAYCSFCASRWMSSSPQLPARRESWGRNMFCDLALCQEC